MQNAGTGGWEGCFYVWTYYQIHTYLKSVENEKTKLPLPIAKE